MKKTVKYLCTLMFFMGSLCCAKSIIVKDGGISLSDAVEKASKNGAVIVIDGKVKSTTIELTQYGMKFVGRNNAVIDFSPTFDKADKALIAVAVDRVENDDHLKLSSRKEEEFKALKKILDAGRGFLITGDGNSFEGISITNASDNGVCITGHHNSFKDCEFAYNHDSGVQIYNGGSYNSFYNCYSHDNVDEWNGGENADGFASKLNCGEGNSFELCRSEYNGDDGWDLLGAHGNVTFIKCQANYNGKTREGAKIGWYSNGNGFKLGGLHNVEDYSISKTLSHTLTDCIAIGNGNCGFDRNNQFGKVTMIKCRAGANDIENYHWPLEGCPSVLWKNNVIKKGESVQYGEAVMIACESKDGINNLTGAVLDKDCRGF